MTSSSEGEILQTSQILRERWKVKTRIGSGGFGEIYEAIDTINHNERVAIKVESCKASKQVLKMEVAVLRRLQGKPHVCDFYGCGRNDKYSYVVMSLQGKNLADLRRESSKQSFSLSTAIRIGIQILNAVREIHAIGFLHRDIKPSNFAMGRTQLTMKHVYMLDFGLARQFLNAKGEIRTPRSTAGFRGTVRYAAVSAHKNEEMGRQDDLWSLFYMLVEFLRGVLPWRRIKDKDEVGRFKAEVNLNVLLEGCPSELYEFATHLKSLTYSDEPDYDFLETVLRSIITRYNISFDEPYDWGNEYEKAAGKLRLNGSAYTKNRSHTTAINDPGEKNRAMDTQAPITMGEDDDEQLGVNTKWQLSNHDKDHDKPKYKRQDFMKPKYSQVNYDAIDAVNARLAAAGETVDEKEYPPKKSVNGDVEATFEIPTTMLKPAAVTLAKVATTSINQNDNAQQCANVTPLAIRQAHSNSKPNQPATNNRLLPVTSGKWHSRKVSPTLPDGNTHAQMNTDSAISRSSRPSTFISKRHSSFDGACEGQEGNVDFLRGEKSDKSLNISSSQKHENRFAGIPPFPRLVIKSSPSEMMLRQQSTPIGSSSLLSRRYSSVGITPPTHKAISQYVIPPTATTLDQSPPPLLNAHSAVHRLNSNELQPQHSSPSILTHFKNLVQTFNSFGSNTLNNPRRSLSSRQSFLDRKARNASVDISSTSTTVRYDPSKHTVGKPENADEEKEIRRQRRHMRRSDTREPMNVKERDNGFKVIDRNYMGSATDLKIIFR